MDNEAEGEKRALIIRSSVWGVMKRTLVVPAQEAKEAAQLQANAKQISLGSGAVNETTRQNQGTSAGLWMTAAKRARARMVQKNKKEAEVKAAESKRKAALDRERLAGERAKLYAEYASRIRGKGIDAIDDKKTKAPALVKILQHLGVRPADMPDKKRPATVSMLRQRPEILAIAQDTCTAISSTAAGPNDDSGVSVNELVLPVEDLDGGAAEMADAVAI